MVEGSPVILDTPSPKDTSFWSDLKRDLLPKHVAFIMDGNGRWAKERGLPRTRGHQAGAESLRIIARCLNELGVSYATFFAFSKENWSRPRFEIRTLLGLVRRYMRDDLREATERDIRFRVIGDRRDLPKDIQKRIAEAEAETRNNLGLTLVLAVSYSGQNEIARAVKNILRRAVHEDLNPRDLDEVRFSSQLDTAGMPDPDLLVRTSGELRISNFLLWQISYSELCFSKVYWPDFREGELREILRNYQKRERRFGKTKGQIHFGSEH